MGNTRIVKQDGVAVLHLDRPEALNALTVALAGDLVADLAALDTDSSVAGIVLTGAGERAFCAGVDLNEARAVTPDGVEAWFGAICAVYRQVLLTAKPVIAALNGVAAGGGFQIALVSDYRLAHAGVRVGQPEINAGIPSVMGSYWMDLYLGLAKNQELSMSGRLIDAAEARALGLVNQVVDDPAAVVPKAIAIANDLAAKPKVAWAHTKARFRRVAMAGFDDAFRAAVAGQREAYEKGEPQAVIDAFLASKARRG